MTNTKKSSVCLGHVCQAGDTLKHVAYFWACIRPTETADQMSFSYLVTPDLALPVVTSL